MREFSQTLSDFVKGLRPDANMPRNSGYATELYNTRCGVAGLEVPPLIVYPISGSPPTSPLASWPFPQLVKVSDVTGSNLGLYLVKVTDGTLTINEVTADYTLVSVFTKADANMSDQFTVADFGPYQIWSNSSLTVKRAIKADLSVYEWTEIKVNDSVPPVRCVCNFRGQLVAGMYSKVSEVPGSTEDNFVAWSEIGSVNPTVMFNHLYGYIDRAIKSGGTVTQPYKGTSGTYRIGPNSPIYRVLPLGKAVIVYCSNKIFAMVPVITPVPTFSPVPIHSFGIFGAQFVGGDEEEHVYIDTKSRLWKMGVDLVPKLLGYREYMSTLIPANVGSYFELDGSGDLMPELVGEVIISKDSCYKDYYISDGTKCYLLSPSGLSEIFQCPSSLVYEDNNKRLIGPFGTNSDLSAYVTTDIFDFGVRGLKTITVIEIGGTGQVMTANIDYKYKVTDTSFASSRFKTASNFGAVTSIVSGTEFKVRVKGADYTKFDLDYLTIRYKYIDKRMIRGVYATDAKVLPRTGR